MTANKTDVDPLDFSDIHINFTDLNQSDVYYTSMRERVNICNELKPDIIKLAQEVSRRSGSGADSFRLAYRRRLYRCTLVNSVHGLIAHLRYQPLTLRPLKEISIPLSLKQYCLHPRLNRGGLILVAGSPGQGKTTTCAAVLVERLNRFGGFCLAIEDPAELPLDGVHGMGRCIQVEIKDKSEYEEVGRMAMRCYPTDKPGLMFISEVRDAEGAALALRAALDGRLVIATMHADSPISALKRILNFASQVMDEGEARQLLYNGFRLCLHQERTNDQINTTMLLDTPSVVPLIKSGKLDMLGTEIDLQQQLLKDGKRIQARKL